MQVVTELKACFVRYLSADHFCMNYFDALVHILFNWGINECIETAAQCFKFSMVSQ